jgi:hypothetical protein
MVATDSGIYLHGGWTGAEELGDFWLFNGSRWIMLCHNTSEVDGPSPRSLHSLAYVPPTNTLYITGRYCDLPWPNELFSYQIKTAKWTLLQDDTETYGGPGPVYES